MYQKLVRSIEHINLHNQAKFVKEGYHDSIQDLKDDNKY